MLSVEMSLEEMGEKFGNTLMKLIEESKLPL
jgi:hypothetical protein